VLRREAKRYPVLTVTGPRQSGKTTLCRQVFRGKPYLSFETLDVRERARHDPRGLLAEFPRGAVFDEIQHVPELLSYLQSDVDDRPEPGRFVLTGSQHFGLSAAISQTLAGRTAVLHLLPPSLDEVRRFTTPPVGLWPTIFAGAYPRIHERHIPPARWLADYVATYVQRDVRQVLAVGDLRAFTTFLHIAAGRTGQEVNLSSLGADVGVSFNTIRSWISVLEASYLCFLLPAWHKSQRKRWVKAPKLHWFDSGLVCHLLGITDASQLETHPLRGAIFESWVAAEIWKAHAHRGIAPNLVHFRATRGNEADLGVVHGRAITLVEAKSGATVSQSYFTGLDAIREDLASGRQFDQITTTVVYGGAAAQRRSAATVIPWSAIADHDWTTGARA
jgi:hypothetical protein